MPSHFHPTSDVQSKCIGSSTRVWQYCVILPNAQIGEDCNICSHCFIENDVIIGNRVTVKCGVQLWDGMRIEDDVFIGPNATFTNDKTPAPQKFRGAFVPEKTIVKKGAVIGAGAIILPGLVIGESALVGAGSVVTKSVPANKLVMGAPARVIRDVKGGE